MSARDSREAWARFWGAGGRGPASGCLPNALKEIDAAQRKAWQGFARGVPRRGRVLDLGTGDGAALDKMKSVRSDLKLVGVDSSPVLPPTPKGMLFKAGVAMESLPFADASFEAVISQFGFEYGDTPAVTREVGRVLRPGGTLQFIVHHQEGAILKHNQGRLSGLAWAARDSGLLPKARALVAARAVAPLPTPQLFKDAPAQARARFPGQAVAEEFAQAILQTLELSRGASPAEALDVLRILEERAAYESERIEALASAVCGRERLAEIAAGFGQVGIRIDEPEELRESRGGQPFAWRLSGAAR